MNRMLHPKADVDRIYLPRKSGGRGLMSAEDTVQLETMNMQKYLLSKKDTLSEIAYAGMKINQIANKKPRQNNRIDKWHKKALYGRFPKIVEQNDTNNSWSWLRNTGIKGETEGLLTATQDQCLNTRNY